MRQAGLIILPVLLFASAAHASPDCMTKSEARAEYPKAYLSWRTKDHCWYSRSHRRSEKPAKKKEKAPSIEPNGESQPIVIADATGNVVKRRGKEAQQVVYPALIASQAAILDDLYTMQKPITQWPLMLDIDATGPDPDNGIDGCCWPPMEALK
jgi:hypothetical protein